MKKIIIIFLIIFFVFSAIGFTYKLHNHHNEHTLKEKLLYEQNEITTKRWKRLDIKIAKIMQEKTLVDEEIFPQTHFIKLNYHEISVDGLEMRERRFNPRLFTHFPSGGKISPFFIETLNEKIILIAVNGTSLFYKTPNLLKKEKLAKYEIKNNLPENITVTDTFVFENQIFVAFANRNKTCDSMEIFYADINLVFLKFEELYSQGSIGECKDSKNNLNATVGRMALYDDLNHPSILITVKTVKDKFNIILLINIKTKNTRTISLGHRNPQGLLVNEKNIVLSTEHGPRGGDEINKIIEGKNYGWPEASYGENYNENFDNTDKLIYKKNHAQHGFEEPIYSFVPSIGISQIFQVPKEFSLKWQNNYLVTSLRARSIYRVTFDENYTRIITMEKIKIGKRIRDIAYNKKYNCFFLALEDETGSLGVITIN